MGTHLLPARPARRCHDEAGAAALETALVLPMMLASISAVCMAAWLGVTLAILEHGAREGARAASIPATSNLRTWPTEASLTTAVDQATPLLTPTDVALTGPASGAATDVTVTVTYVVTNPFAVLASPLALFGVDEPLPRELTFTSSATGRRE